VVSESPSGARKIWRLSEILPDAFGPGALRS